MNFFRTTYTLCTKISALNYLTETTLLRAVLHTILLMIICSFITASCTLYLESEKIDSAIEAVNAETGGFYVHGNSLVTKKDDISARHFVCELHALDFRLDYFGTKQSVDDVELNRWDEPLGMALTPSKVFFWNGNGKKFTATVLEPALLSLGSMETQTGKMLNRKAENVSFTADEFQTALKNAASAETTATQENTYPLELGMVLKTILWLTAGLFTANQIFLLALLAVLILPLIEMIRMRALPNKLPYKKLAALTLYATFPGFIAASIFEIFASHILSFQTVFFIVFIIYQMLAFGKLILYLNPQLQNNSRDNDDNIDDDDL